MMADDLPRRDSGGPRGNVDLVTALADLGDRLAYPADPGPAFTAGLVAAIEQAAEARRDRPARLAPSRILRAIGVANAARSPVRRALALAVVLVVLLAAAAAAATFTIRGIRLIFGPPPVPVPTSPATHPDTPATHPARPPLGSDLFLGEHATLEEARSRLRFPIQVPSLPGLGRPEVYISQVAPGGVLNLVYPAAPGAPPAETVGGHGVHVLVSEFVGRIDRPFMQKFIDHGTLVESVTVGPVPGLWVSGEPHEVAYVTSSGSMITDSLRLSANALLWQHGELTLRLETAQPLDMALAIARSMR